MKKFWRRCTQNVPKKDLILILVFSLAFVFNLFVFNQFDIILHNQNEFGLTAGEVSWAFAGITLLIFVGLFLLLFTLCNFAKRTYKVVLAILCGLMIATYAQVLLFNGNTMNVIDGSKVFTGVGLFGIILNCLLFVVIIGLPGLFMLIFKKKHDLLKRIFLLLSVVIFGMQFIGLIGTAVSAPKLDPNSKFYYFSVDDYLQVSKEENIIVFVMDRLSTEYTEKVFAQWPAAPAIFNGFTWYKNNLSEFSQTFPSVVQTLTGVTFDKSQAQTDFLPYAWQNTTVFKALKAQNYTVNGLLDSYANYYSIDEVRPYFDNIKTTTKATTKINYDTVFGKTTQIALMRNMPFALKEVCNVGDYSNLANQFVDLSGNPGYYPKAVSPETDVFYYQALKNTGLSAPRKEKTFSFVHLNSAHDPIKLDEDVNPKPNFFGLGTTNDIVRQAYGSFKILDQYFTQLKALHDDNGTSLFDKSTIIVMADHGFGSDHTNITSEVHASFASLFIKRAGETADIPLYVNETAQMSNRNFAPTIMELLGLPHTDNSYFDIDPDPKSNTDTERAQTRYFYLTAWQGWTGRFQALTQYKGRYVINGDAFTAASWVKESAA